MTHKLPLDLVKDREFTMTCEQLDSVIEEAIKRHSHEVHEKLRVIRTSVKEFSVNYFQRHDLAITGDKLDEMLYELGRL